MFQIFKLSEGNLPVFTLFLKIHSILRSVVEPTRSQVGPNWTERTRLDRADPTRPSGSDRTP